MFTATFKKIYIQLLHVLIGQSIQPSVRDVRGDEDCDIRIGGSCGVRDGDARSGVRDGGACGVSFSSAARSGPFLMCLQLPKKKYYQLLHVLIGQSFQSLDRDAWALPPPPFV